MSSSNTYAGSCFCGAVGLSVTGSPAAMGYCHCASCRQWSAGPINAFTLWEPTSVQVERGAPSVDSYQKTENSIRKWCKRCGGHLLTEHPKFGLVDVYAATIPSFPFVAALHVNYGETVLPIRDGLPKQKDFPEALGGSGILLPE